MKKMRRNLSDDHRSAETQIERRLAFMACDHSLTEILEYYQGLIDLKKEEDSAREKIAGRDIDYAFLAVIEQFDFLNAGTLLREGADQKILVNFLVEDLARAKDLIKDQVHLRPLILISKHLVLSYVVDELKRNQGFLPLVEFLRKAGVEYEGGVDAMFDVIGNGGIEFAKQIIQLGFMPKAQYGELLDRVIKADPYSKYRKVYFEAAELLVKEGADVNYTDESGISVLSSALKLRAPECLSKVDCQSITDRQYALVKSLLKKGADVNNYIEGRNAPLVLSIWSHQKDIMRLLIARGADLNVVDNTTVMGSSAFALSILFWHSDIAKIMIISGADPGLLVIDRLSANEFSNFVLFKRLCRHLPEGDTPINRQIAARSEAFMLGVNMARGQKSSNADLALARAQKLAEMSEIQSLTYKFFVLEPEKQAALIRYQADNMPQEDNLHDANQVHHNAFVHFDEAKVAAELNKFPYYDGLLEVSNFSEIRNLSVKALKIVKSVCDRDSEVNFTNLFELLLNPEELHTRLKTISASKNLNRMVTEDTKTWFPNSVTGFIGSMLLASFSPEEKTQVIDLMCEHRLHGYEPRENNTGQAEMYNALGFVKSTGVILGVGIASACIYAWQNANDLDGSFQNNSMNSSSSFSNIGT